MGATELKLEVNPCDFTNPLLKSSIKCSCTANLCNIIELNLKSYSLPGTLPRELVNLTYLQKVSLTANRLSGELPKEWGNFPNLTYFRIIDNHFEGSIPESIGNFTKLKRLEMYASGMTGPVPAAIFLLENLTKRFLSGNKFNGSVPDTLLRSAENIFGLLPCSINTSYCPRYYQSLQINCGGENVTVSNSHGSLLYQGDIYGDYGSSLNYTGTNWGFSSTGDFMDDDGKNTKSKYLVSKNSYLKAYPVENDISVGITLATFTTVPNLVVKGHLSDGTAIAVKQLSSKLRQGNREFVTEIGMISGLQHPNLVKLYGCCIEGNQLLLVYEYMEHNCLARALFGSENNNLKLDWPTRHKICVGIARGQKMNVYAFLIMLLFLQRRKKLLEIVDPNLGNEFKKEEAEKIIKVALLCTNASPALRPTMSEVVGMLEGLTIVQEVISEAEPYGEELRNDVRFKPLEDHYQQLQKQKNIASDRQGTTLTGSSTTSACDLYPINPESVTVSSQDLYQISPDSSSYTEISSLVSHPSYVKALKEIAAEMGNIRDWSFNVNPCNKWLTINCSCSIGVCHVVNMEIGVDLPWGLRCRNLACCGRGWGILLDSTIIAVKQLSSKSRQGNREFVTEIGMISGLEHPNLVRLYGCCIEGNQLLLVYEYMENNSLARALFGREDGSLNLDWPTRQKICIGNAKGLTFLHEESILRVVHRDIKATNILLDGDLNPKISDFGLAKLDEEEKTNIISTRIAGTA
ncbi:hypothetical protein FEM48_Zijuj01G0052000 [Ziziphus jujuba var. spinosa]|uniref:non-specific serine/threonine protein kinase n=1 Tax=Ziziphus jujuba var. spinosa TaxID=714518 RepID=A0A978VZB4_ZIZJJ|nr:hypothetical protein FEM48_Zijuj01G0052000 [Ziziphus jujuba var. spinosa]